MTLQLRLCLHKAWRVEYAYILPASGNSVSSVCVEDFQTYHYTYKLVRWLIKDDTDPP